MSRGSLESTCRIPGFRLVRQFRPFRLRTKNLGTTLGRTTRLPRRRGRRDFRMVTPFGDACPCRVAVNYPFAVCPWADRSADYPWAYCPSALVKRGAATLGHGLTPVGGPGTSCGKPTLCPRQREVRRVSRLLPGCSHSWRLRPRRFSPGETVGGCMPRRNPKVACPGKTPHVVTLCLGSRICAAAESFRMRPQRPESLSR